MSDSGHDVPSPSARTSSAGQGEIFSARDYYRLTYDGRKVRCYLRLLDPARMPGTPPTAPALAAEVLGDCERRGIQQLAKKQIEEATQYPVYSEDVLIAEGRDPVPGRDGTIQYRFRTDLDAIQLAEDTSTGRVDFRELGLIENVKPGQILATATKPTPGRAGLDVFGKPIRPTPGQAARIRANEYVKLSEDGLTATSTIDGYVRLDGLIITVAPVYFVSGDVDFRVGNIDFNGTVRVSGSVLEDFRVVARGDIIVDGDVEKGTIEAEGSVLVRGSVLGKEESAIRAGKDIVARFAVNARLEAGGDVRIAEELVNSDVHAGGGVRLDGVNRRLMGGAVVAYTEVRVGSIGSENGLAKTHVALRLQEGLLELAAEHDDRRAQIEAQCLLREGALGKILALKQKVERLTGDQYGQLRTLMEELQRLRDEQQDLAREAQRLRQTHADQLEARIVVEQTCYPGTTLCIHDAEQVISRQTAACAFAAENGQVVQAET